MKELTTRETIATITTAIVIVGLFVLLGYGYSLMINA